MKKSIIYIFLATTMLFLNSCEESQSPIYDGEQTLAYFGSSSSRVEVELNTTSTTITIPVNASTLSDVDRTVSVTVLESSTAAANQYDVASSVTIPAGSYFGSLDLTGFITDLTTTGVSLTLQLEDGIDDGGVASPNTHTATIALVCPIPETYFTGTYLIEQQSGVAPFGSIQPAFGTQLVDVVVSGPTSRTFDFLYAPLNFQSDFAMTLILACEEFQVFGDIQSGSLSCDGGATQIGQRNSSNVSTYSTTDDSSFSIFFNDFAGPGLDGGCGVNPYEIEITMTKQ
jgi:hypothetical protein